jgi:hypothetical protein
MISDMKIYGRSDEEHTVDVKAPSPVEALSKHSSKHWTKSGSYGPDGTHSTHVE